jgi:hypothetical protein
MRPIPLTLLDGSPTSARWPATARPSSTSPAGAVHATVRRARGIARSYEPRGSPSSARAQFLGRGGQQREIAEFCSTTYA